MEPHRGYVQDAPHVLDDRIASFDELDSFGIVCVGLVLDAAIGDGWALGVRA